MTDRIQMPFVSFFGFGDRVMIDGEVDMLGVVTGCIWRDNGEHAIEVSWVHNGVLQTHWFAERRLTRQEAA